MAQMSFDATTDVAPDDAWKVVGNFDLTGIMPGVDECKVDGETRTLQAMGTTIVEQQVERDDAERMYSYTITDGPFQGLTNHKTTVRVVPEGDGSRIIVEAQAEPDEVAKMMEAVYQGLPDALKAAAEK